MTGIFLLAVVAAVWYLRNTEVDPRLYGSTPFNAILASAASPSPCWASTQR